MNIWAEFFGIGGVGKMEDMEKKEREAFRKACEGIEKGTPFSGIDFVNEKCKDCGHQGIYRSMKGNFRAQETEAAERR